MRKLEIIGMFWKGLLIGGQHNSVPVHQFSGEIIVDEIGEFKGVIIDEYGEADVYGVFTPSVMEFHKKYRLAPPGCDVNSEIYYLLRAHNVGTENEIISGGWKGIYKIDAPTARAELTMTAEEHRGLSGEAICILQAIAL